MRLFLHLRLSSEPYVEKDAYSVCNKPRRRVRSICLSAGRVSPAMSAIAIAPEPENMPLKNTIAYVSFSASFFVQLFSNSHDMVASSMRMRPGENFHPSLVESERIIAKRVMRRIESHPDLESFSLKIITAIKDVATISKLLTNEDREADEVLSPFIRSIGEAIQRIIIQVAYL